MNIGNAINEYRIARWFYLHHMEPIAWLLRSWTYLVHNSFVPYKCEIGARTILGYKGIGCVIHSGTKIGKDCVIGTNVTIGGGHDGSKKQILEYNDIRRIVPVIGDRVYIGTGAKILGNIVIGDDVIIGANAVVISDVPSRCVMGGIPAKVLRERSTEECISPVWL